LAKKLLEAAMAFLERSRGRASRIVRARFHPRLDLLSRRESWASSQIAAPETLASLLPSLTGRGSCRSRRCSDVCSALRPTLGRSRLVNGVRGSKDSAPG